MIRLRYGNTNTFYFPGNNGGLLVDTDYAGTLPRFFRAIKAANIAREDIAWVLATHYHPDHIGLVGELQALGATLVIVDAQLPFVHFADAIFSRDKRLAYKPVDEGAAKVISPAGSRDFLRGVGIGGEILLTPSHSADSVSLILDNGDCLAGDLEPYSYLAGYGENSALERDWENILGRRPRRIFYAHANETTL